MAQTGYTPISLYYSSTASAAPTSGNLTDGELAINITDGKLFYKDNSGNIQIIGYKVVPYTAGGTGLTAAPTNGQIPIGNGSGYALNTITAGSGVSITNGAGTISISATGSGGTVSTVSVVSANGLAGTVANATTTPAITLSTSVTGVLKGDGTSISAASAGTDYVAPGTATTFTALQTFNGSTSVLASKFVNAKEAVTVSATAATGTINYDATTQSVLYYTSSAAANWTVNFRASSGTSLDTAMSTGESITVAFLVTQGSPAYYNNIVQVDGSAVTPKWQGGAAPTAGNASSIDAYVYTIVKTGSAAFTVFASLTQFA